jgi:hypothetical protein
MNAPHEQPELFPALVEAYHRNTQPRKLPTPDQQETFARNLFRALQAENISSITWAILAALDAAAGRRSYILLISDTGLSYHAIRNQVHRSLYFEPYYDESLVKASITKEGREKLARIKKRTA